MKRIFPLVAIIVLAVAAKAQDVGVEKLIYPKKHYPVFEVSSTVPAYWSIKNYGDTIQSRVFTVGIKVGDKPKNYTLFRSDMAVDEVFPFDPRNVKFYQNYFDQLLGIESVIGFKTPEYAAGDTLKICLEATVTGDTNPANDSACFEIILADRQPRDLDLHILSPKAGTEVSPNHTVSFDVSVKNQGSVAYTDDSVFVLMQVFSDNKVSDVKAFSAHINKNLNPGDSTIMTFDYPTSVSLPEGDVYFIFNVSWLSEDRFYVLGESSTSNNRRYVKMKSVISSVGEVKDRNIRAYQAENEIIVNGNFEGIDNLSFTLLDMQGRVMKTERMNSAAGNQSNLSTAGLAQGVYLLNVVGQNTLLYRQKIMVH
ncbi:T9SS type A sorting domain-containing protein [bacterium]|nr:T9SS type A sorting domain-containing protein [bacterium]